MVKSIQSDGVTSNRSMLPKSDFLIDSEYEKQLGAKLATIEELRIEFGSEGIECPGVLVVGAQSAGKSSVLERLTGISFPRAENTCTRVPTIDQLQTDASVESPLAVISKNADFKGNSKQCSDMKEIQDTITSFTDDMVTAQDPIRDDPIHIRYVRKNGPVMTLIDLPGITHGNTSNRDFDIHQATSSMVRKYMDNKNMIVLAVIPANDDFGNSEALQIAQRYDEEGIRTIGVVSKCDLVPEKSDIVQKIRMTRENDVQLALGFIAVRNKGPGEDNLNITTAEDELFSSHKLLRLLHPDERGYVTLSRKIVELQSQQVNKFIPEAKKMVQKKIIEIKEEQQEMGDLPKTSAEQRSILSKELCEFDVSILKLIRAEDPKRAELNIAARGYELAMSFAEWIRSRVPDWLSDEIRDQLSAQMKEKKGFSLPNFISDSVFRNMITEVFFSGSVRQSTITFVDDTMELVHNVIRRVVAEKASLAKYPNMASKLIEESEELLRTARRKALELTSAIIAAEETQIFTLNPGYVSFLSEANRTMQTGRQMRSFQKLEDNLKSNAAYMQSHKQEAIGVRVAVQKSFRTCCLRIFPVQAKLLSLICFLRNSSKLQIKTWKRKLQWNCKPPFIVTEVF